MWRIIIMCMAIVALAGCGGGRADTTPPQQSGVIPTATPFPTLIFEERVQYTAGFIENPFRLAIRPDSTIQMRVLQILGASTQLSEPLTTTTPLSRLAIDDIAPIQATFLTDFNVGLSQTDWDEITTVGDIIRLVERRVSEQVVLEIYERTSLYFEVILLDSYGEGLRALCESDKGVVTIPILDGMTVMAALANDCGDVALQIAKNPDAVSVFMPISIPTRLPEADMTAALELDATPEADLTPQADATSEADATPQTEATAIPEATPTSEPTIAPTPTPRPLDVSKLVTGTQGVWLISRTLGSQNIGVIQNRVLCRLNIRDFYSWFLPDLLLDIANVQPLSVIDKAEPRDLVSAIANDECAGGMLSADQLATLDITGVTIGQRSITFPYGVVMYPLEVELGIQLRLNEVLPQMAQDPIAGRPLRLLIGQDALLPIRNADLADLNRFIGTTGYDLSQLGR
ncbi:MAG: hypothetical protein CUN52_00685 [Phototrophicales bacterium]|nr:MAG: hypothetical protein CUN52_00685 [Phototrophicales bacterium]